MRDQVHESYFRGLLRIRGLEQDLQRLEKQLAKLNQEEKAIRGSQFLLKPRQTVQLQAIKRKKHRLGEELADIQGKLHLEEPQQEIRREERIDVGSAYSERLLEVADRIWNHRIDHAKDHIRVAMKEIDLIDELLKLSSPPQKRLKIHPINPNAPLRDLKFRRKVYTERIKELDTYLPKVAPREARRKQRVQYLIRLLNRGMGDEARVRKLLDRERDALERVMQVRRRVERFRSFYLREIAKLDKILKVRTRKGGSK